MHVPFLRRGETGAPGRPDESHKKKSQPRRETQRFRNIRRLWPSRADRSVDGLEEGSLEWAVKRTVRQVGVGQLQARATGEAKGRMASEQPRHRVPEGVFRGTLTRGAFAVYVPENYEPNYTYPVLILLHNRGAHEAQLLKMLPRMSRRNYVAIALRGLQPVGLRRSGQMGYSWNQPPSETAAQQAWARGSPGWSVQDTATLDEYAQEVLDRLDGELSLDTERVYLVGYGEGAAAAYRIGLGAPWRYAGLAAINGWFPEVRRPWLRWPAVRRLRALVLHGESNPVVPVTEAERAIRLLYSAGVDVAWDIVPGQHRITRKMLRLLNSWLMDGCANPS
jgi:phospholipase/carboxylesterase